MAVEIPVVVDIDKAFQDAAKRVPQAIEPLQRQISKKTLNMQVDVGTQNTPNLRKFKDLLSESQSSATELHRAISSVNKQIKALSSAGGFNPAKGLKQSERELLALKAALETKLGAGNFLDATTRTISGIATGAQTAGRVASTAINATNAGLRTQGGLLSMLLRNLTAYSAVFAGLRLIKNIREVTAEFEMQRVALAGIIQDTTRANQLFAEVKAAAVRSPFEIKDLVTYTKQLSAYRIETDKLFDVTMRLADVSAGLGVDMNRLVLAYGQVRAASVLRGQELRQFTEAGIPLVDLLAKKFTQLRGEMVSTGEVFELISDRAVPFAMIEDIFNDMTSAGGIFYEMQLKQSETLKGQWMKLKDVISIAYDEMGRTAMVNNAMTGWIRLISNLVKNWERIASVVNVAVYSYLAYQAAVKGLIPFYNMQQRAIARQIQLEKQQQIEQIRLASKTNQLSKADQRRIALIKQMTAEDYKRIFAMDKMTQSQSMLFYWRNKDNKEIVKAITQTGILTKSQMTAINKMNWMQIHLKTWGSSIRTFFKTVGSAIASFWPIAAVSALITAITSLIQTTEEQSQAISRVDKAYHEQEQTLLTIENAYRRIQKAIADVTSEQDRATASAESFGEKLGIAQKMVEMLKKYGLGGDFDLSLLNTDNIDDFVETWLSQLNRANELTRDWGRNVARVANAWELSVLGIHLAGDNLNTDIKQLTNAFVKLTSDKGYRQSASDMRNYLEQLEITHKESYDILSAALGEDAKLAVAQKRRNETEYQYQMRLIKNYETIRKFAQSDSFILSGALKSFKSMDGYLSDFEVRLNEVEKEFNKTWGAMEGQDEITIKMAIDKLFAENQWEDWLKEAWIERVNSRYQMNIQVVPSIGEVSVPKGIKGIIATEFENLFTEQELENMNSVSEIGKAIEEKMKKAADAIADADKMANNLVNNEVWSAKTREKIKNAQLTIDAELAKSEKDRNEQAIRESIELIDALTKQNGVYEEQIVKKKEAAKAEYDLAKAASERLLSDNLSDMATDIRRAFPGLMKDAFQDITNENYISKFLISDEDLQKIKDGSDAYDVWAKHMKEIADEREKMLGAGVSEQTVLEEQTRLDAERLSLEGQLAEIAEKIAAWSYSDEKARYDALRLAVQQAATAEERAEAEAKLTTFVQQNHLEERALLEIEQQRLTTQLGITNAALGAQQSLKNYFKVLDEREKAWTSFGQRYNFSLQDKSKGGSAQDPWILLFKNRMKFMQDFQKGVEDLNKYLAHQASLSWEQETMKGRGLSLGIKTEDLLGTPQELRQWYDKAIKEVAEKIRAMGGREFQGLGVTEILAKDLTGRKVQKYQELLADLWKELTDFDTKQIKRNLEEQLQKISDEMKRSETARSFFDNILDLTGDEDIAANMSISVYGSIGAEFKQRMQKQLNAALSSLDASALTDELKAAFESQDYDTILKNIDKFPDEWQKKLKEMADSNAEYNAEQVQSWLKDLQKVKTYGEQRVLIAKQTAEKIRQISESELSQEQKDSLSEGYRRKEAEEVAKLQYDAFKDSPMYVELFSDLDQASTMTLTNMRNQLQALQSEWKNLDPVQLKEMQRRMQELDEQLARRNPFKAIIKGLKDFNELRTDYGSRDEIDAQNIVATNIANTERELLNIKSEEYQKAKEQYDMTVRQYDAESDEVQLAKLKLDTAKTELEVQAEMADIAEENANAAQELSNKYNAVINSIAKGVEKLSEWQGNINDIASGVGDLMSAFGASDDVMEVFDEMAEGLSNITEGAAQAGLGVVRIMSGDIFGGIASLIGGVGKAAKGLTDMIYAPIVKSLDKQIEKQQDVVSDLEKEYNRLEKAIANAFGTEYVQNFNRQLENLYAQQAAYEEQARLERAKGKKADEEVVKGYLESAENTAEQIRDMQGKLAEHFTGSDVASAARDFAKSWIDAYRSFSSTTQAMRENFREMIDNMIVESLAGQLIKELLDPVFKMIDGFAEGGFAEDEIAAIADRTEVATQEINNAMTSLMQRLTAAGLNIRGANAGLTGISREIAGASEQSINALAAGINTQNYYMSFMPAISANVEAILLALGGDVPAKASPMGMSTETSTFGDEVFRTRMENIDGNIGKIVSMLRSVITGKSSESNTHVIAVK